jgi:hypothetical protein
MLGKDAQMGRVVLAYLMLGRQTKGAQFFIWEEDDGTM